jgi:acetylglutamate kinase
VHGGGPNITEKLRESKITTEFVDGMRVTDEATLKIVEDELNELNDLIVREINAYGALAKGFKREDLLIRVEKKNSEKDLGFVGDPVDFDRKKLSEALETTIPIIAPMGVSSEDVTFNINADDVAFFLASQLKAEKLVLLTNVLGVMRNPQDENSLISTIKIKDAQDLIEGKVVGEGMIPKVKAAVEAIEKGVGKAHIVDAKIPHAILLEIFTNEGIGTEIIK